MYMKMSSDFLGLLISLCRFFMIFFWCHQIKMPIHRTWVDFDPAHQYQPDRGLTLW